MVGGALGAALRFYLVERLPAAPASGWSFGILAANVIGCFGLGLVVCLAQHYAWPLWLQLMLGTGVMGALTTFSSYADQIVQSFRTQGWLVSLTLLAAHLTLGIAALLAGAATTRLLPDPR